MKYLLSSIAIVSFALSACATTAPVSDATHTTKVINESQVAQVIAIPTFKIEVSPVKASCDIANTDGSMVQASCIQFRQPFQKNFNTLTTDIQGFDFEPGYRYLLDVRQEAVVNTQTGITKPIWLLNEVINKTPAI